MPRISKTRGKHKPNPNNKELSGISQHKICLISTKDEYDFLQNHGFHFLNAAFL